MKNILMVAITLLFAGNASASHFCNQELNVEVTKVENLSRLDGVSIWRGYEGGPVEVIRDVEQIVVVKVNEVLSTSGHSCGLQQGTEQTLHVKKEQVGQYKVGDQLTVHYANMGDSLGSRITWEIIN